MIFEFLDAHKIQYRRVDHPPVFTCEEADRIVPSLPGAKTKNLFLRDGKGRKHFLLAVSSEKNVDLKALSRILGVNKLGFASADRLEKYLNLTPGAVTLLGVVHDSSKQVEVVVDSDLWSNDAFLCHPLVNTSTLLLDKMSLTRFFELTGHSPRIISIPGKNAV